MRNLIRACCALTAALFAPEAFGATLMISWSGYLEPLDDANGWHLDGDGSFATTTDGSVFTVAVELSTTPFEFENDVPFLRGFLAKSSVLNVDGHQVETGQAYFSFTDNRQLFPGAPVFDSIGVSFDATFLGATYRFTSDVRLHSDTFDLYNPDDPAAIPLFFGATASGTIGGYAEDNVLAIVLDGTDVDVRPIPLPGALVLMFCALSALICRAGRAFSK